MMKVKYVGESFGVDGLTNEEIYECLGEDNGMLRIINDSGEDYLYSISNPRPRDGSSKGGHWEIIEDDKNRALKEIMG